MLCQKLKAAADFAEDHGLCLSLKPYGIVVSTKDYSSFGEVPSYSEIVMWEAVTFAHHNPLLDTAKHIAKKFTDPND